MALCQYTYFRSIVIAGVGIATVLQYLAPSMIYLFADALWQTASTGEIISSYPFCFSRYYLLDGK